MYPIFRNLMIAIAAATLLAGCGGSSGSSVPPEKSDYLGEWYHPSMSLLISSNGKVKYKREEGGSSKSFDAYLKRFEGDNFIVGFGPMNTTFVVSRPPHKEGENWMMTVDGLELTRVTAGIQSANPTDLNISAKEEKVSLTKKSMHDFAVSVQNKSMEHFHNSDSVSKALRKQFTVENLNEAYASIINLGIDFTVLDSLEPILEGDPLIDEKGRLVIKGHYLSKSDKFTFEHRYHREDAAWKLVGFDINVKPASSNLPVKLFPTKEEQISLTKKSMHDFAVSVNNKSMEHFRNTISIRWQSQFTTAKLDEGYGAFFTMGVDLATALDPLTPRLDGEVLITEEGVLVIKGHYPTKPSQVVFEHKYVYEGTAWKLLGFTISIQKEPGGSHS